MTDVTTSADAGNVAEAVIAEAGNTVAETAATTTTSTTTTNWRDTLPEDIRASPSLTKFETQEGLAKSYINLEKMLGTDKVAIPKEGDQEGWERWVKAAGRPDDPKDYGFEPPKELPAGLEYSPENDQRLAAVVHKAGLNKHQAGLVREEFMRWMGEGAVAKTDLSASTAATQETQLRTEWGRAFDQNLKEAKLAVKEYGGDEFAAYLETTGLGNHPALAKAFHTIARKTMGESQLIGNGGERESTPADLDKAITDFRNTHSVALFDKAHADHAQRTAEYTRLFEKRHGD
ncbi:hypothetical protein [Candidatus Phyllobacterium onerii]|uniref:hypothetical protein n=1 Tax=Candidatus Phyllobacterium onerii TaxID=3020828 RepID=UPI00232B82DF|nr:hypothetical protein [Phyllobacterium sp. IY22]